MDEDMLEVTQVDNKQLSKAELLSKLISLETAHSHLLKEYDHTQKQLKNGIEVYQKNIESRMLEQDKLLAYYERKFKLLKDFLNIEEGDK